MPLFVADLLTTNHIHSSYTEAVVEMFAVIVIKVINFVDFFQIFQFRDKLGTPWDTSSYSTKFGRDRPDSFLLNTAVIIMIITRRWQLTIAINHCAINPLISFRLWCSTHCTSIVAKDKIVIFTIVQRMIVGCSPAWATHWRCTTPYCTT